MFTLIDDVPVDVPRGRCPDCLRQMKLRTRRDEYWCQRCLKVVTYPPPTSLNSP